MQCPTSLKNRIASSPKTPDVSIAIGTKICEDSSSQYRAFFLSSLRLATIPAPEAAAEELDGAKVSLQLTSQANAQPDFHGTTVTPSTHLPSDLKRPDGSRIDGISTEASVFLMSVLRAAFLGWRPALLLQCKP